jgi:hypothetical protein
METGSEASLYTMMGDEHRIVVIVKKRTERAVVCLWYDIFILKLSIQRYSR